MKEYNIYHNIEIPSGKLYLPGTVVIHFQEKMEDKSRNGIKEKYLFDGISICFLIFELTIGVKIYNTIY